jgi:hypothetical protein
MFPAPSLHPRERVFLLRYVGGSLVDPWVGWTPMRKKSLCYYRESNYDFTVKDP